MEMVYLDHRCTNGFRVRSLSYQLLHDCPLSVKAFKVCIFNFFVNIWVQTSTCYLDGKNRKAFKTNVSLSLF